MQVRTDRARDDDGDLSSELFAIKNADIEQPMHEYIADQTAEATKLQKEVNSYMAAESSLETFESIVDAGKQKRRIPEIAAVGERNLAKELMGSEEFQDMRESKAKRMDYESDVNLKTLFETTGAGAADMVSVESVRTGEYVTIPRTRVTLLDIIPQLTTDQPSVKYDEETKNLSNVAPIAQGAIYQQSEFTIQERTVDVYKAGAFIQVSEELLDDEPEIRARLDGSLRSQMLRRIQSDIVGGAPIPAAEYVGTPTNNTDVTGFLDIASANINEINGTGVNQIAAIEDGAEMVYRLGEAQADAIVMNSQDWVGIKKLQSTTGSFVLRGANSPLTAQVPMQLDEWQVVLCNALPQGTVLVGAFSEHCAIRDRQSVQVRISEAQGVPSQSAPVSGGNAAVAYVAAEPTGRVNIFTDARLAFYIRRGLAFTRITNFGA